MAQKNAASAALAALDTEIAARKAVLAEMRVGLDGVETARVLLVAAMNDEDDPVVTAQPRRKRGPNKKRGLPAQSETAADIQ